MEFAVGMCDPHTLIAFHKTILELFGALMLSGIKIENVMTKLESFDIQTWQF